jgi:hypothetical protein
VTPFRSASSVGPAFAMTAGLRNRAAALDAIRIARAGK